jgi:hypothetical protein
VNRHNSRAATNLNHFAGKYTSARAVSQSANFDVCSRESVPCFCLEGVWALKGRKKSVRLEVGVLRVCDLRAPSECKHLRDAIYWKSFLYILFQLWENSNLEFPWKATSSHRLNNTQLRFEELKSWSDFGVDKRHETNSTKIYHPKTCLRVFQIIITSENLYKYLLDTIDNTDKVKITQGELRLFWYANSIPILFRHSFHCAATSDTLTSSLSLNKEKFP